MKKLREFLRSLFMERDWAPHPKCTETGVCQETECFKGTEHEGVDMCEDGCVWGQSCWVSKFRR